MLLIPKVSILSEQMEFWQIFEKNFFNARSVSATGKHGKTITRFVIIFAPFSFGRFIKSYISKCLQFCVEYCNLTVTREPPAVAS